MKSAMKIHILIKWVRLFLLEVILLSVLLLFLNFQVSIAQEIFEIKNVSNKYNVVVRIETTNIDSTENGSDTIRGPARVCLFRKGDKCELQVIKMANVVVNKESIAYNPKINAEPRSLYTEEYSIIFEDFNFDDSEDMAICNGRAGGYGGPSYNIYLFNKKLNKFIYNKDLSQLTNAPYLGLFFTDVKNKLLVALSKSGCCYHKTEKYNIISSMPVMVEQIIEDSNPLEKYQTVTTKKLVNGKWVKTVQKKK